MTSQDPRRASAPTADALDRSPVRTPADLTGAMSPLAAARAPAAARGAKAPRRGPRPGRGKGRHGPRARSAGRAPVR